MGNFPICNGATGGLTACEMCPGSSSRQAAEDHFHFEQDSYSQKTKQGAQNKDFAENMAFIISRVPLFKNLPKDMHPVLAGACQKCFFRSGEVVIKQGDEGNEFFIIKEGEAAVTVFADGASKHVATLTAGDYFGENALLRDEPRQATISASSPLNTLKITRDKFESLGLHRNLKFAHRKAVGGGGQREVEVRPPDPKTKAEQRLIADGLRGNENLTNMLGTLSEASVNALIDCAWKETCTKGKEIIRQSDINADYFYIVQQGCFEIFVSQEDERGGLMEQQCVGNRKAGESFGELALLYLVPRAATVRASEDNSVVWVIDRPNFKKALMQASESKIEEYIELLKNVEILNVLLHDELEALAKSLTEMRFDKGQLILRQGDPGSTFYILIDGDVQILKDGNEQSRLSANPQRRVAQYFGERALLTAEPRAATIRVASPSAQALALDRDAFNLLLAPLDVIIKEGEAGQRAGGHVEDQGEMGRTQSATRSKSFVRNKEQWNSSKKADDAVRERIIRSDLKKIGLLGSGGFATVELFQHGSSGKTFAMKALDKQNLVQQGMQSSVLNEKNILLMTNSPFIIKLYECYCGRDSLYFLLEPALGGELYATYNKLGLHGSVDHARFYSAGVVYAFEHLHDRHIIYRDLKPENLLLTSEGYIKLTDFGLSTFVIGKTYTTCGTPDYFAPELIASAGHTHAVDWWMLGILIFELMAGHPPFETPDVMTTYSKVMKGIDAITWPLCVQGSLRELIRALLKQNPTDRLPCRQDGHQLLKDHPWYKSFDWAAMAAMKLQPPYKPPVKNDTDLTNFANAVGERSRWDPNDYQSKGWDREFAT